MIENPFRQYVELLRELHLLMSTGKGDSKEADDIRDQMDMPWLELNDEEHIASGRLSEYLYEFEDRPQDTPSVDELLKMA